MVYGVGSGTSLQQFDPEFLTNIFPYLPAIPQILPANSNLYTENSP